MAMARLAMLGALMAAAAGAAAQGIPEIDSQCQAENARISAIVQQQCLPLGAFEAKLACTKRVHAEQHADAACLAKTRARLVALNRACRAGTAPAAYEHRGSAPRFARIRPPMRNDRRAIKNSKMQ